MITHTAKFCLKNPHGCQVVFLGPFGILIALHEPGCVKFQRLPQPLPKALAQKLLFHSKEVPGVCPCALHVHHWHGSTI